MCVLGGGGGGGLEGNMLFQLSGETSCLFTTTSLWQEATKTCMLPTALGFPEVMNVFFLKKKLGFTPLQEGMELQE